MARIHNTFQAIIGSLMAAGLMAATPVLAAAITQGFHTNEPLVPGTIVSVQTGQNAAVVAADSDHADSLLGVVADGGSSAVALSAADSTVQVTTTGVTATFVSDLAGPIKSGDQITASPIKGVGMKATDSGKIVGVAQSDFDSKNAKTVDVTTKDKKSQSVHVGTIPVAIQASYYSPVSANGILPPAIQALANTIARKNVSVVRVLIGVGIGFGAILTVGIILFSAVRSAIVSIGRNPLAQADIYKGLLQVLLTCVAILGVCVGGIYLILNY